MKQANRGRLLAAGSALMMALGVAGCGQKAESPGKAGGERVYRIAFASFGPDEAADIAIKGYLEGLRDEGFVTGRNLEVIQRHAGGEIASLPLLMQSLEGEGLDLIVPMTSPGVAAACSRVKRTPVVFVYTYDPIAAGAGKDFDHHLPNITGVASFPAIGKTMAAVRELVPNLKTLGTVYNASEVNSVRAVREARQVLEPAGIKLEEVTISTTADVLLSTQALLSRRVEAIWVTGDNTVLQALEGVLGPASRARIPVVLNDTEFVDRGAVAAIGISWTESGRMAGHMAARVLRGESPADIPIVNVAETKILVNRKQAALIGVTLPPSMDLPTGKRP